VRSHAAAADRAAAIEAEIARLRSLALDALRRRWRVVFGRTPPAGLSKDLLGRMIAWRMQEQAFGGLDRESLMFLEGLARHGGSPRRQLKPGTVLVRDYQGQTGAKSDFSIINGCDTAVTASYSPASGRLP
jgi:hypothetical protein